MKRPNMKVARNLSDYATYLLAAAWALVLAFTVFLAVDAFIDWKGFEN